MKEYEEEFGIEPSIEEIAAIMGIKEKHVKQAMSSIKAKYLYSIDKPVGDEGNRTLGDIIPDTDATAVDEMLDNRIIRKSIVSSLGSLSKREEMVLRLRFGISDVDEEDENIYEIED